jgi:hypothetical protein
MLPSGARKCTPRVTPSASEPDRTPVTATQNAQICAWRVLCCQAWLAMQSGGYLRAWDGTKQITGRDPVMVLARRLIAVLARLNIRAQCWPPLPNQLVLRVGVDGYCAVADRSGVA